ncbi:nuclear transport factor 2 family protein [Streptomyces sp. SP17BM10]|uniref:nuclear transport factor 2 family protein n=1 Tax=Streptomyces sp. SP17BM10 TaxID=3002530 RepID=UPI002E7A0800|nr:nuclear transport factor 2 family protein [Streptomyces sp. SP17BM10]MEE1784474.1 nuclear transport factor 2 family protein [Streptomyces sp. SP17BM10]
MSVPAAPGTDERLALADRFRLGLTTADWALIRSLLTDDVVWTLPGDNTVSGQVRGVDAVIERIRLIASYGVHFDVRRTLLSRDNLALSLHNTAERDGRVLDEHLATVCFLRGERIGAIETYVSDVPGMNAFFV